MLWRTPCPKKRPPFIFWITHTHPFNGFFSGLPGWAGTRKVKPIWILLKQEIVSGNGIRWATCKSAPHSRQITMPTPHHSVFYKLDALPATQPTASKHWRHMFWITLSKVNQFLIILAREFLRKFDMKILQIACFFGTQGICMEIETTSFLLSVSDTSISRRYVTL